LWEDEGERRRCAFSSKTGEKKMLEAGAIVVQRGRGYPMILRVTRVLSAEMVECVWIAEWVSGWRSVFNQGPTHRRIADLEPYNYG
jgi:hypothetical protein